MLRNLVLATLVATVAMTASNSLAQTLTAFYDFEGTGADRFDDPAGAFADDLIGQRNPMFSFDAPSATGSSQSAEFMGDTALFTDAYTTDLGPDPDAFTIMFWIKARDIDQENNNTRLLTTRVRPDGSSTTGRPWQVEGFGDPDNNDGNPNNDGTNGDRMDVRYQPTNGVYPQNWFSPDATDALARQDQGETVAEWRHVAFVLSNSGDPGDGGAYGETYVNGVSVGLGGQNPDWDGVSLENTEGQLIIGGSAENAGSRAFTGLLDDFALFAGIVSAQDIADIAAGTISPLSFNNSGPTPLAGDFNGDGTVDAADYTLYADNVGQADESAFATGTGDGMNGITIDDYNLWRSNFGNTTPPLVGGGDGAVPEPGTIALLIGGVSLAFVTLRKRSN